MKTYTEIFVIQEKDDNLRGNFNLPDELINQIRLL